MLKIIITPGRGENKKLGTQHTVVIQGYRLRFFCLIEFEFPRQGRYDFFSGAHDTRAPRHPR